MPEQPRITNRFARAALLFAAASVACAVLAIAACWTWMLVPYVLCTVLALGAGVIGWSQVVRRRDRYRGRPWAGAAIGVVFLCYAGATYFTAARHTWERAERVAASGQLKALGESMSEYYRRHERFPPAALRGKDGRPLLSWRVAVLPILGQQALFDRFALDEPWDSAHNHTLLAEMPSFYAAAHRPDALPPNTVYQVLVGPRTPFDPTGPPLRLDGTDFPHPVQELFLIVEAAHAVPWTKPDDLEFAPGRPLPPLGSVLNHMNPPLLFVPRPSRWMLATRVGAGPHWVDLDALDDETLRQSIACDDE